MGKALHPKVCGCGSSSFTKEKAGKPWYCESCELGFCTKCGEWPLLIGSDKSCGVCIAQQAYPDCTGCFVYDDTTNVSLLQHHGNTCPVHEDKENKPYGAVNTHHNPHVNEGPIEALCCSYHWPSQPPDDAPGHDDTCHVCTGTSSFMWYTNTVTGNSYWKCAACGYPASEPDNKAVVPEAVKPEIIHEDESASEVHHCSSCDVIVDTWYSADGQCIPCHNGTAPLCEMCHASINPDAPEAHWACSKSFQKETCLCGAFDFQQPNDDKAITCGNCGLTYCAQGCTAMIVDTDNEFCDLHNAKPTMYDKLHADMKDALGENVVSHKLIDQKWGEFVLRLSNTKAMIHVDFIVGEQHITLMTAMKEGPISVNPPAAGAFEMLNLTAVNMIRHNWIFKRYGIPFRVGYKKGLWIMRPAGVMHESQMRVFQNEQGSPSSLVLTPGS